MHLILKQRIGKNLPVPVVITVYEDRSFDFIVKTTPASVLLKKAAGLSKEVQLQIQKKLEKSLGNN